MEIFSMLLVLCAGNSPATGEFLHKGQWRGALVFSLVCANGWANSGYAVDLRHHRAHYDVMIMQWIKFLSRTGSCGDSLASVVGKVFLKQCFVYICRIFHDDILNVIIYAAEYIWSARISNRFTLASQACGSPMVGPSDRWLSES